MRRLCLTVGKLPTRNSTRSATTLAFPNAQNSSEQLFHSCYVLNLDRRPDRWSHVLNQIQKHKIASLVNKPEESFKNRISAPDKKNTIFEDGRIERVSGVDGIALCCVDGTTKDRNSVSEAKLTALEVAGVITADAKKRLLTIPTDQKLFGMDLTPGGVGCALGHMRVWDKIASNGPHAKHFLILEDDVEFAPNFYRTIRSRVASVPDDYDILYFGGLDLLSSGQPPRPFISQGLRFAYAGHRELTAYVVKDASVARRLLAMSRPMQWQIDTHITNTTRPCPITYPDGQVPKDSQQIEIISDPLSYVLQPSLAIQVTSFGTDVQKQAAHNPNLEDASRRLREFVAGGTSLR